MSIEAEYAGLAATVGRLMNTVKQLEAALEQAQKEAEDGERADA
jgi:hypothetical protein